MSGGIIERKQDLKKELTFEVDNKLEIVRRCFTRLSLDAKTDKEKQARYRRIQQEATLELYWEFVAKYLGPRGYLRQLRRHLDEGNETTWECGQYREIGDYDVLAEGSKVQDAIVDAIIVYESGRSKEVVS